MTVIHKQAIAEVLKQHDDGSYDIVISTQTPDRDGDVIEVAGWETGNYMQNPVVLFAHDYRSVPIGRTNSLTVENDRLVANFSFRAPANEHDPVLPIKAAWDQGILRAASVGFRPLDKQPLDPDGDNGGWGPLRYTKQELLEFSLVGIPANQEALRRGFDEYVKSLGMGDAPAPADKERDDGVQESAQDTPNNTADDELDAGVLEALAALTDTFKTLMENKHG